MRGGAHGLAYKATVKQRKKIKVAAQRIKDKTNIKSKGAGKIIQRCC